MGKENKDPTFKELVILYLIVLFLVSILLAIISPKHTILDSFEIFIQLFLILPIFGIFLAIIFLLFNECPKYKCISCGCEFSEPVEFDNPKYDFATEYLCPCCKSPYYNLNDCYEENEK